MQKFILISMLILFLLGCENKSKSFSGYIDTDLVYLSSDFSGRLVNLATHRGQLVNTDQFLFKLEQTSELYDEARSILNKNDLLAQRQQIMALLNYNEINYRRITEMRKHNAASQGDLDAAKRDLDESRQQVIELNSRIESSKYDIKDKKWRIKRKENYAPTHGIIFDTYYTQGEFVQAGYPILSLITKNNVKAIFFVPEKVLSHIRINDKVKVTTNENPNLARGHIFYISNIAEFTPPILYSREERERLVFRIEAKIDWPDLEKLHLGQPISLEFL